jgi:lysylphosphatidylglycerol synthetase-like protein (DUF2156 family)
MTNTPDEPDEDRPDGRLLELAGHRRIVPDELTVALERGARALVFSDLRLANPATDISRDVCRSVARAVEECRGPAAIVLAGDMFDLREGSDVESALLAHQRLSAALAAFVAGEDHRLIVLPGIRDSALAHDQRSIDAVTAIGGEVALACVLEVDTGVGSRLVHVEPGHRLDQTAAYNDPRDPNDRPLAQHLVREVGPGLVSAQGSSTWLAGIDDLVDTSQAGAFVASRLAYRRLLKRSGWLIVPAIVGLALFWSFFELTNRHMAGSALVRILRLLGAGLALELAVVGVVLVFTVTQLHNALGGVAWWGARPRGNDDARGEAVTLASAGAVGLITAHTRRPELTDLGGGSFYANCGSGGRVVECVGARAGFPPVFVERLRCSWIELEAGAELHARLWHGVRDLPTSTWLERLAARERVKPAWPPSVVARHPGTVTWPSAGDATALRRRTRRIAAAAIALAAVVNLASSATLPLASRLGALRRFAPIAVPEAAAALVALAGVGLLILARGVRRGQRHAWALALALLLVSVGGHVVKGLDVEEATLTLLAAVFLATHASDFAAPANPSSARRAAVAAFTCASVAMLAGVVGVELNRPRLPIGHATSAVVLRFFGNRSTSLPHRVDVLLSPALLAVGVGIALLVAWLAFRPAVAARTASFRPMSPERARYLVERYGSDSLSYFALRSDKDLFGYRDTIVAYRVHNGIALVSPDPVGPVSQRADAWAAFREFADEHGWSVAVMAACGDWLPVYGASGMHDLYIGDEAVVDVRRFTLDGKQNKSLRQSVSRVRKAGYRVEMFDPAKLDPLVEKQLRELMTESRKGDVERGFSMTLGRAFEHDDRGLLLAVAFDSDDRPAAFCQYVPARAISGWSLDLMRRSERAEHPNGLTELVVVDTIEHLRREGYTGLALNFATFRAVLASEAGDRLVHRVEKWFLERMSDSMQIESLWTFNEKFQPEWHPRYACYDSPEHLLAASIAVARAESFWELPLIGRFFGPRGGDGDGESRPRQLPVPGDPPPPEPVAPVPASGSHASGESGA